MTAAVFDTNVLVSGLLSPNGPPGKLLDAILDGFCQPVVTDSILAEYETVVPERLREEIPDLDPEPKLAWIRAKSRLFEPAPLGKQRSRDLKDDPYLACALAARAQCIITYDRDLLSLGKPFGVEIIRPAELLRRFGDTL